MKGLIRLRDFLTYFNIKTLIFNFHYFPYRTAILLPVFLSRNAKIRRLKGIVRIDGPVRTGMIRFGTHELGIFDKRHNRPIWENAGKVIFKGTAIIKYGAKIVVGKSGILTIGNNLRLSSGSFIICYKSVDIGESCRISWNTQILDTDFHKVFDSDHVQINSDRDIRLGNYCWIGNRCSVLKGTHLGDMVVLSANSMINKHFPENNIILAGTPAKIIRNSITWGD